MAYTLKEARERVIRGGLELMRRGLIARTYGNISARISETQFVITPSGRDYDSLKAEDIVICNIYDDTYLGEQKPSSEVGIHREAYRLRPSIHYVIHTHQTNASALSILGQDIVTSAERSCLGEVIPCTPYALSGSKELQQQFALALREHPNSRAFLLRYHGAVCLGSEEEEAFFCAEALERETGWRYEELTGISLDEIHTRGRYAFTDLMSTRGEELSPYLDDMAMAVGVNLPCLATEEPNFLSGGAESSAVLIRGKGARILSEDPEEKEAVALILEKGCQAAYLGKHLDILPLPIEAAKRDRKVYLTSYQVLRQQDEER